MCNQKREAVSKTDKLIESMDRLSTAIENLFSYNAENPLSNLTPLEKLSLANKIKQKEM